MAASASWSRGRLADGMVIAASVRARVLGIRLLDLRADIAVAPSAPVADRTGLRPPARTVRPRLPSLNGGVVGGHLDEVAAALAASESELSTARRRMP